MKWLVRRVLLIALTLALIFAAVVVLVRLNPAPSTLQQLGFGVCAGEPCFRGIKLGMDWEKAQKLIPNSVMIGNSLDVPINIGNFKNTEIYRQVHDAYVDRIILPRISGNKTASEILAGDVVVSYGVPCRLGLLYDADTPSGIVLQYPQLAIWLDVQPGNSLNPNGVRLRPDSPTFMFSIANDSAWGTCERSVLEVAGTWQGFTSVDVYLARFLRAAGTHAQR
jgi:hypothetical protein